MADTYVGEIRMFGGNFAPMDWHFCDGSLLPISTYDVLYSLIGTTYGGDGVNTFAVPDLRGRVPLGMGQGPGLSSYVQGQMAGAEQVTLLSTQIPQHTHTLLASTDTGSGNTPGGAFLGNAPLYTEGTPGLSLAADAMGAAGNGLPHANLQPSLSLNFIIALNGLYPSRS